MKKIFYDGLSFNGCAFIRELSPQTSMAGNKRRIAEWKCVCGDKFTAAIGNVKSGQVSSCGCKKTTSIIKRCTKHGHSPIVGGSKLYRFWQSMKDRCTNPNSTNYKNYGGRGITMHEPWRNSFEKFRAWFNGHFGLDDVPEGLSMDRKDNDSNYCPDNLRLATLIEQANNRRNNRVITYLGTRMTVAELARKIGIKQTTLRQRLNKGLTPEQASIFTTMANSNPKGIKFPKEDFIERKVSEPLAVRLAGEFDIWDKRDPRAEIFQFGLRVDDLTEQTWYHLLEGQNEGLANSLVGVLLSEGKVAQKYQQKIDASTMGRSFLIEFEGLKFLTLNTARCNSLTFAAKDVAETAHDALLGFYYNGKVWTVSLYHAKNRTELDLSAIAIKYGGGGHRGACGFTCERLPFI